MAGPSLGWMDFKPLVVKSFVASSPTTDHTSVDGNNREQNSIIIYNLTGEDAVDKFDAILFNQRTIFLPGDVPRRRHPRQYYVHWSMESPVWRYKDHTRLMDLNHFFNWSMSYRLDSHFTVPYGSITKIAPEPHKKDLGKNR